MRLGAAGSTALGGARLPSTGVLIGAAMVAIALLGLGFIMRGRLLGSTATVSPTTVPVTRQDLAAAVSATGTVISTATSKLSFATSGLVAEVAVVIGDQVKTGQVLARQDTSDLEPAVLQAQANLAANQAKLALLLEGAKPEDLAAAQASVDAAQAKLADMQAGPKGDDLAAAQANLDSAQAKIATVREGAALQDLAAAQAAVDTAKASLDSARARLDLLVAGPTQAERIKQEAALSAAHSGRAGAYARVLDGHDSKASPSDRIANTAALASAEAALKSAQAAYEEFLKGPSEADVLSAKQAVTTAEANLNSAQIKLEQLASGPTESELLAAQSAVVQAQTALNTKLTPYSDVDLLAQEQAVKSAQANLANKRQPYQQSDILAAQAAILQSEANLAKALGNLAGATIVAPFDGVVSAASMNVGEMAANPSNNNPTFITVVDPSQMRVDVQVDESDIANVAVGQIAVLTFDALPGRRVTGRVMAVAPNGTLTQGVVGFPVSIEIQAPRVTSAPENVRGVAPEGARAAVQNARGANQGGAAARGLEGAGVRAGMTATATIEYERRSNVLTVPNRAIVRQGRDRFVEVRTASGETERRKVEVGMANDDATEITSGVTEGEILVLPLTAARASVPGGAGAAGLGGVVRPGGTFVAPAP